MTSARLPDNEAARLEALYEYDILDTLPEQAYDDITEIAANICATPIALVTLIDADRQWIKSARGMDVKESTRDAAFCSHAILDPDQVLVVEDATKDPRFKDNPFVVDNPGIRFYAGAPLKTHGGFALGTLCVVDFEPRTLTEAQSSALAALARQVVAQLDLRRSISRLESSGVQLADTNRMLTQRNAQMERSRDEFASLCRVLEVQADTIEQDLHRAETIQRCLLPSNAPRLEDFCVHTLYRPGRNVGGDLFDVVGIDDRYVAMVIADAAGHGVSAAMLSVLFKQRLETMDDNGRPLRPCEALARLNTALVADLSAPGVFVTAAYALLDTKSREMQVASAGHAPMLWLHANGETETINRTGPALGLYEAAEFGEQHLTLEPDDRFLMLTDGVFDVAERPPPDSAEIATTLRNLVDEPGILSRLLQSITGGTTHEDRDDVTLLLLEAKPGESRFYEPTDTLESLVTQEPAPVRLLTGQTDKRAHFVLHGRVTWTHGDALFAAAVEALNSGRELTLDLGECQYLDSTLLGTLHELVERAVEMPAVVTLQRVPAQLVSAFEELSMEGVLAHVVATEQPLPEPWHVLELPESDVKRQQRRLLHAHEVLAELSDSNRAEFAGVIAVLKDEADASGADASEVDASEVDASEADVPDGPSDDVSGSDGHHTDKKSPNSSTG